MWLRLYIELCAPSDRRAGAPLSWQVQLAEPLFVEMAGATAAETDVKRAISLLLCTTADDEDALLDRCCGPCVGAAVGDADGDGSARHGTFRALERQLRAAGHDASRDELVAELQLELHRLEALGRAARRLSTLALVLSPNSPTAPVATLVGDPDDDGETLQLVRATVAEMELVAAEMRSWGAWRSATPVELARLSDAEHAAATRLFAAAQLRAIAVGRADVLRASGRWHAARLQHALSKAAGALHAGVPCPVGGAWSFGFGRFIRARLWLWLFRTFAVVFGPPMFADVRGPNTSECA